MVPEAAEPSVLGQPMAVSLPAGALLTRAEVGAAALPAPGQALLAVLVKPGQAPPDLAAGARVLLVLTPPAGGSAPAQSGPISDWAGTVTAVQQLDGEQGTVVVVQLPRAQAMQVAALPAGQLSVVATAGGGR